MAKALESVNGIEKFDPHTNPTHLGQAWDRWFRSFQLYATGKGAVDANQKRALLLHCAGLEVQDIFFTLEEIGGDGDDAFTKCVKMLAKYFSPKVNVPYERYQFRNTIQERNETVEQYKTKLRQKAVHCKFDKPKKLSGIKL